MTRFVDTVGPNPVDDTEATAWASAPVTVRLRGEAGGNPRNRQALRGHREPSR